ncbi:MAG: arsenite S-adenosylmethyltransferase [Flexibacter sp. CG_4_10_14_3_um_filter_32_15]|nr:MAG: arsenite S-adenosylmethyltransferase [Flexibacter sp. CG_4_10_14_3_um_filter_32_15]
MKTQNSILENQNEQEIKNMVRERYEKVALQDKALNASSCCGTTDGSKEIYNVMSEEYDNLNGYNSDADLGLGCGLPTQFAQIKKGDTVLDLGSGAGNDCFVARHETGETGKVIGIDFSENMLKKARQNADNLGYNNVEFREGDIENMPVSDNSVDVIVSNCVLNLVPNKKAVFTEMYRVLKDNGHFSISDIVLLGELPEALQKDAEMYAGCVSGAIQKEDYLGFIKEVGFENIVLQKEKAIFIPTDILQKYLSKSEIEEFRNGKTGIFSSTVFAQKNPSSTPKKVIVQKEETICTPGGRCC